MFGKLAATALLLIFFYAAQAQLMLNEVSQGSGRYREYIELVVTGKRTCTDSTADLRGWIIDDQNGWYGARQKGISPGHFRFAAVKSWEKVPFGSIILLYNGKDKNKSISIPDDPTDADNNLVYVVPHNSPVMETHNRPVSPSSPTYVYPVSGYNTPLINEWQQRMSFNNVQDAIVLVKPTQKGKAFFSLAYGLTIATPFQKPTILLPRSLASSEVCRLMNGEPQKPESWSIAAVPLMETPGMPNSPENGAWIAALRQPPAPLPVTKIQTCITEGESFNFNGTNLTTPGLFTTTYISRYGCDSLVELQLSLTKIITETVAGCGIVIFKNKVYASSATVTDTLKSLVTHCDSIYYKTNLVVNKAPTIVTDREIRLCKGATTTLTAAANGATLRWLPNIESNSLTVTPAQTTDYYVVAVNTNGCADTAKVKVTVHDFKAGLFATQNPVTAGEETTLYTKAADPYTVLSWSPEALFINQQATTQTLTPKDLITVTVVVKNNEGCLDTANLLLKVVPDEILIPDAFSPNGDGINDVLNVVALNTKLFDFKLFNRWGQLVFSTTNAAQSWNGSYNGTPQPAGVYAYTLNTVLANGQNLSKRGTVLLLR